MANEYLKRTPTSTGNRKIFTYAGWFKKNSLTDGSTRFDIFNAHNTGSQQEEIGFRADSLRYLSAGSTLYGFDTTNKYRDTGNWFHIVFALNTTLESQRKRSVIYINGVEVDTTTSSGIGNYVARNFDSIAINVAGKEHNVLARKYNASNRDYVKGQGFDVFFVDGQALTPDVFGFHKDGDGYVSAGSTQVTNFRPGQWMPHSPAKIKKDINRRGGFGVNGFYLPMNDSSNPGADFHCAPNSIIKLKGEDLPQPRNGAPTTSDAYVSQLRQEVGTLGFDGVVKFDGVGDYLTFDGSSIDFGTGDFTVEAFIYHTGGNDDTIISDQTGFTFTYGNNGKLRFYHANGSNVVDATVNFISYRWVHVAVVRSSNTLTFYQDGNAVGSHAYNNDIGTNSTTTYIGKYFGGTVQDFDGFVSNLRVIQGTALYTANFTAPSAPLTNVTNTKLLCCNSSTSATAATVTPGTITANGNAFATKNELTGSIALAVPGISTATGANLVTNGHFDTNTSGWSSFSSATLTQVNGTLKVECTGGDTVSAGSYNFATVNGQRYTVSVEVISRTGTTELGISNNSTVGAGANILSSNDASASLDLGLNSRSFTATGTTTYIGLWTSGIANAANTNAVYDNVIVKQEDAPRDYSADIKGSGTNKTLTAAGSSGVGYELGGYYGSALSFPYAVGQRLATTSSDFAFGTGDFTVEVWIYPNQVVNYKTIFATRPNTGGFTDGFNMWINANGATGVYSNAFLTQSSNGTIVPNQWTHVVAERYNSQLTTYVNGVAASTATNTQNFTRTVAGIGELAVSNSEQFDGAMQDVRVYKGVAKYKGGFDVPKPYTPVGIEAFRTTSDTCKNNFATWNAVDRGSLTLSDGNLSIEHSGSYRATRATIEIPTTGKWYYEHRESTVRKSNVIGHLGIGANNLTLDGNAFGNSFSGFYWGSAGLQIAINGSQTGSGWTPSPGIGDGDILNIAYDADSRNIWLGINGTYYTVSGVTLNGNGNPTSGTNPTGTVSTTYSDLGIFPYCNAYNTISQTNFGQNPSFSGTTTAGTNTDDNGKGLFKYAPPTGFLALCEDNLPTPAIADPGKHFKTVLYTGDGNDGRSITGVGFQPDLVWVKRRNAASDHSLQDSVRGFGSATKLASSSNYAENTINGLYTDPKWGFINSVDNNGFSLSASTNGDHVNRSSGDPYVAWCWKAGGAAVSNSDGSITTQVSANPTAGFSIVKGTQTSGTTTFGHGLGKAPKMVITKQTNGTTGWYTYHKDIGSGNTLRLDTTAASTSFAHWVTDPTTSVFSMGSGFGSGETYVAYCFAEIEGYSKIGSYTGNNNADGPFVYCGFKPAWVMIKETTATGNWLVWDSSRKSTNPNANVLVPNSSMVEYVNEATLYLDMLSNGFKIRSTSDDYNTTHNYIFMAFAESPFQTANAK